MQHCLHDVSSLYYDFRPNASAVDRYKTSFPEAYYFYYKFYIVYTFFNPLALDQPFSKCGTASGPPEPLSGPWADLVEYTI